MKSNKKKNIKKVGSFRKNIKFKLLYDNYINTEHKNYEGKTALDISIENRLNSTTNRTRDLSSSEDMKQIEQIRVQQMKQMIKLYFSEPFVTTHKQELIKSPLYQAIVYDMKNEVQNIIKGMTGKEKSIVEIYNTKMSDLYEYIDVHPDIINMVRLNGDEYDKVHADLKYGKYTFYNTFEGLTGFIVARGQREQEYKKAKIGELSLIQHCAIAAAYHFDGENLKNSMKLYTDSLIKKQQYFDGKNSDHYPSEDFILMYRKFIKYEKLTPIGIPLFGYSKPPVVSIFPLFKFDNKNNNIIDYEVLSFREKHALKHDSQVLTDKVNNIVKYYLDLAIAFEDVEVVDLILKKYGLCQYYIFDTDIYMDNCNYSDKNAFHHYKYKSSTLILLLGKGHINEANIKILELLLEHNVDYNIVDNEAAPLRAYELKYVLQGDLSKGYYYETQTSIHYNIIHEVLLSRCDNNTKYNIINNFIERGLDLNKYNVPLCSILAMAIVETDNQNLVSLLHNNGAKFIDDNEEEIIAKWCHHQNIKYDFLDDIYQPNSSDDYSSCDDYSLCDDYSPCDYYSSCDDDSSVDYLKDMLFKLQVRNGTSKIQAFKDKIDKGLCKDVIERLKNTNKNASDDESTKNSTDKYIQSFYTNTINEIIHNNHDQNIDSKNETDVDVESFYHNTVNEIIGVNTQDIN